MLSEDAPEPYNRNDRIVEIQDPCSEGQEAGSVGYPEYSVMKNASEAMNPGDARGRDRPFIWNVQLIPLSCLPVSNFGHL